MEFRFNIVFRKAGADTAAPPSIAYHKFERPNIPTGVAEAQRIYATERAQIKTDGGTILKATLRQSQIVWCHVPTHRTK